MGRIMLGLAPLVLAGCATAATAPAPERYAGFFERGFEVESFHACGEPSPWWVTDAPELRRRYAEVARAPYERVYAVVVGETGPVGRFGQLGGYTRELAVSRVEELRAPRAGDCE